MPNPLARESLPSSVEGLRVSLLGPPELTWKGHALSLPRRESRALLYRLATHPKSVPREELAFLFWPESPESTARRSLTFLLGNLRRAVPSRHLLLSADDAVTLDWSACSSDAVSFQQLLAIASADAKRSTREQAVQLVRGQFLAGFSLPRHPEFEAWAATERSTLERLYLEALAALVQDGLATGEFRSAIPYARRYLDTDELAESMYRYLIGLYALNGERGAALREFERCAIVLERELHLDPSPETRAIYQAVVDARPASELLSLLGVKPAAHSAMQIEVRPFHNLPAPLTSFVGRQSELAFLHHLLVPSTGNTRLLTLTGAGGSGKTRLALEVARGLLEHYADGIWWVDLAPLADAAAIPQALASALRVKEQEGRPLLEILQEHLHSRHILLLLDNCEHVLEACGQLADRLLTTCPQLVVLATSREAPLGIPGETDYVVPVLSLPDLSAPALAQIEQSEAAQLFLARATSVRGNFVLNEESAEAVCRICVGLDGLPLALELAAARLNMFTIHDLASRLADRFRLLTEGARQAAPRHQTLHAAIDWSYQLLTPAECLLLRRLSVFAGGFTPDAVEAVCVGEGIEKADALRLLTHLLTKSLVVMESAGEHARYRLLETVRQFAWERLCELQEAEEVQERHARYFVRLGGGTNLLTEPQYHQLSQESGNVRAALNWLETAARTGESAVEYGELLLHLSAAFAAYCWHCGWIVEGREWTNRVLDLPTTAQRVPARAWLLWHASPLYFHADFARARACLEESIAISREQDDRRALALALSVLSFVVRYRDGPMAASPIAEEALSIARAVGDMHILLSVLNQIGQAMHTVADDPRSRAIWEEYLAIAREVKDEGGLAGGLVMAGIAVNWVEGNYRLARARLEEGITILERLQSRENITAARFHLALVLLSQGELHRTCQVAGDAVKLAREMGERRYLGVAMMALALVTHTQGKVNAAVPLAEEALSLGREVAARGDRLMLAWTLWAHGRVLTSIDPDQARVELMESLALERELSLAPTAAWVLYHLAWLALLRQESEALVFAREALSLSQEGRFPHAEGWARLVEAEWARQCGEPQRAAQCYDQAEGVFRALGANGDLGILLHGRGCLAEAQNDPVQAATCWTQSLALARQDDCGAMISANLRSLAGLAFQLGHVEWATRLIAAADALKVELVWSLRGETARYLQDQRICQSRLGEKAFAANAARGHEMPPEQVDALANRIIRLSSRVAPASQGLTARAVTGPASPLSLRELQVLGLAAQRMSDAEIGEQLVVSPRTVTTHLTSIYRKLGVGSRIEAVQAASALGLIETDR